MKPHASIVWDALLDPPNPARSTLPVRPVLAYLYCTQSTQVPSTKPLTSTTDRRRPGGRRGCRSTRTTISCGSGFGGRVQKVSLDAGFTCPNVDGTVAKGGCTFCDNRSFSPSRRLPRAGILGQIDQSIARMRNRYDSCDKFLAYFQPATNTYAPVERLRPLYEEALTHPQVVGPGHRHPERLRAGRRARSARGDRRPDVPLGRVRHADDARPLARVDEPRARPRIRFSTPSSGAAAAASRSAPT